MGRAIRSRRSAAAPGSAVPTDAQLVDDEARENAQLAHDAEHHPDPLMRAASAALLEDIPDDIRPEDVVEVGPGPYRAPAVARALAEASVAYRTRRGLTQRDLAQRLQVHQSQVARIESGERTPALETLVRVARELGLTLTLRVTPEDVGLTVEGPGR